MKANYFQKKGSFTGSCRSKWLGADSMSTLSGQASKGEKTKPKFQSLDINNLYRVSRVSVLYLFIK